MPRSVFISTPIPSLEEFGKSLGLSKTRQKSLLRIVRQEKQETLRDEHHRSGVAAKKRKAPSTKK